MKRSGTITLLVFIFLSFIPCYAHHMAVVVGKDSNLDGITSANLARIFKAETKKWPDGKNVVLVLHTQSIGEMVTLQRLNKMTQTELEDFIAAHKNAIYFAVSDADVLRLVQSTPGAIGLVDVHSINDKVKVIKVDGKLPLEDGYLPH